MAKKQAIGPAQILPALEKIFGEGMVTHIEGDYVVCLRYPPPDEETLANDALLSEHTQSYSEDIKPQLVAFLSQLNINSSNVIFITPGATVTDAFPRPHAVYVGIPETYLSTPERLGFLENFEQQSFATKKALLSNIANSIALENTEILASGNISDPFILKMLNTLTKAQRITWEYDAANEQFVTTNLVNNARAFIGVVNVTDYPDGYQPNLTLPANATIASKICLPADLCRQHLSTVLDTFKESTRQRILGTISSSNPASRQPG